MDQKQKWISLIDQVKKNEKPTDWQGLSEKTNAAMIAVLVLFCGVAALGLASKNGTVKAKTV